jgi:hypothetical protein
VDDFEKRLFQKPFAALISEIFLVCNATKPLIREPYKLFFGVLGKIMLIPAPKAINAF